MGIFDIFTGRPTGKAIASQVSKAKEQYAQPEYRRMAMEKLLKWDTPESLAGVVQRFCVVVQSPHWDEVEKQWLVEEIVERGEHSRAILRDFILKENDLAYALDAYRKIVQNDDAYVAILWDALEIRKPADHRSVRAKQELIAALAEMPGIDLERLVPYLHDHSDDVQSLAISALADRKDERFFAPVRELIGSDIHSSRVMRAAADAVSALKIPVAEDFKIAGPVLEDFHTENGLLVRNK
jgi:lipopolysaccharide biosynthesis regulator YciM